MQRRLAAFRAAMEALEGGEPCRSLTPCGLWLADWHTSGTNSWICSIYADVVCTPTQQNIAFSVRQARDMCR